MYKSLSLVLLLITATCVYGQQEGCKVLLPGISGAYVGECKKGLAHGKGLAQGTDRYEGHFSKGLPEGKGVYKWADGSWYDGEWKGGMRNGHGKFVRGDSIAEGFWKADSYQGKKPVAPYKIQANRNVQRWTITKSVELDTGVRIKLMIGGQENSEVEDFTLAYSSGNEFKNVGTYGIEHASVPLDVTIRYTTWNQLHSAQYDVLFEVTITEPGTWNITLVNM
jgi:hypothetical protein